MQSVKAIVIRTALAMASAFRTSSVRAFRYWTLSVKANVVRTTHATVSAF